MSESGQDPVPPGALDALVLASGYWEWQPADKSVYVSRQLMDLLGLYRSDPRYGQQEILELLHPDDRDDYRQGVLDCLRGRSEEFSVEVRVRGDDGGERCVVNRGVARRDADGRVVRMSGSVTDITAQRRLERAIRLAASHPGPGADLFASITERLAESLDCDIAFIGRLAEDGESVRTLSVWCDGAPGDPFEYPLAGSPCCNVIGHSLCIYPDDVWRRFPEDVMLVEGRFRGYAGIPLSDSNGQPIGLIAVIFREGVDTPELAGNVLAIHAARAAAEIERVEREAALVESERRFRDFAEASADHFWETDEEHRFVRVSEWTRALIGVDPEALIGMFPWDIPGSRPVLDGGWDVQRAVLDAHQGFRDFQYSLRGPAGELFISVSGVAVFDESNRFRGHRGIATDITERVVAQRSETAARKWLALAVDSADYYVWDWEIGTRDTHWHAEPSSLLGPRPADGYPDFRTMVHEDDQEAFQQAYRRTIDRGDSYTIEFRLRRTDGQVRWLQAKGALVRDGHDAPARMIGITQDVTARREAEEKLRLAATVFNTREPMMITDAKGVILDVNQAFLALFGYSRSAVLGQTPAILQSGHHDAAFFQLFWRQLREDGFWQGEMWNRSRDGTVIPNWMVIDSVTDAEGNVSRYVATCNDISERKQAEDRIRDLAWYDVLTRLPNRRLLVSRFDDLLEAHRRSGRYGGLLLVDIDDFKTVNESLGYRTGDAVLAAVGERLATLADTVGRVGADEFAVLLPALGDGRDQAIANLEARAASIAQRLAEPVALRGETFRVSCSLGIHVIPEAELGPEELLSQCEIALNRAKRDGYRSARFYHPEMKQRSDARLHVQHLLSSMTERDRVVNLYQAQVDEQGQVVGVEALARLRDDDGSLLSPHHFIGVAEETGLIFRLGEHVLHRALTDLGHWRAGQGFVPEFVAVNVSPRQFLQPGFVDLVVDALADAGQAGHRLELEITENLLVEDFERVAEVMAALKAHGVRFAVDDFGTGYSSLAYLNRLPIDKLKIDRSFVAALADDESSRAIVTIILSMARAMHLSVVAEGVETAAEREALAGFGCRAYQGFLFDRPLPAAEMTHRPSAAGI